MIFMGIVGEYIGAIHTFVQKRPLVFEKERINFQYSPEEPMESTRSNFDNDRVTSFSDQLVLIEEFAGKTVDRSISSL